MSSSCCEVMGKLPVVPLSEIRFRLVSRSLTARIRPSEAVSSFTYGLRVEAGPQPHESFLLCSLPSICTCENR